MQHAMHDPPRREQERCWHSRRDVWRVSEILFMP
jgi:hypothetical protein